MKIHLKIPVRVWAGPGFHILIPGRAGLAQNLYFHVRAGPGSKLYLFYKSGPGRVSKNGLLQASTLNQCHIDVILMIKSMSIRHIIEHRNLVESVSI